MGDLNIESFKGLTLFFLWTQRRSHTQSDDVRGESTCCFDVLAGFLVNSSHWALYSRKKWNFPFQVLLSLSVFGRRSFRVNKSFDRE